MIASPEQLRLLYPHARPGYLTALQDGRLLAEHGLNEPICFAMFLAQAAHECGEFTITEENGNYSAERLLEVFPVTDPGTAYRRFTPAQAKAYAHKPKAILSRVYARKDLGNGGEASGDGWRYRGRGPWQTTGKDNYRRMGARLGVDLVSNPDMLATDLSLGWRAGMLEWTDLGCSKIARELGPTHECVLKIARGINLGNVNSGAIPNGLADRKKQFDKIWKLLGDGAPARLDPAADGILEEGEQGEAVKELQLALAKLGYAVGEADGDFGPRTTAAVAALQARESLIGDPGKYRTEWAPQLAAARPFDDAPRQTVTAKDLAAKGDGVVSMLLWARRGLYAAATYLGLDTAADQAGVQLPANIFDLRKVIEPLATVLQWFGSAKPALGIAACIGAGVLASWAIRELVKRYRQPFRPVGA
jgi:putative chitinase